MNYIKKTVKVLCCILPVVLIFTTYFYFTKNYFRVFIPSESMLPTLQVGDQLLVKKVTPSSLKRGDIIVFLHEGQPFIKRLIGMPGDTINIENGKVLVNGCVLDEPYLGVSDRYSGVFFVPEGAYFVLGDNRADSYDSRYWENGSFVGKDYVMGVAVAYLYPKMLTVDKEYYEVY